MPYTSNKLINDLEAKTTPIDADSTIIGDSADSNRAKKTTWANIKATLKAYFDTIYTNGVGVANRLAYWVDTDTVGNLDTSTYPSLTEISYVKGATSALQTQITAKAPSTAPTFATSITGSYLTASELLGTGASKEIVSLPVATYPSLTELSYVKGVTSAIQTQLNAIGAPTYKNGVTTRAGNTASGTQTIAHGLGAIPKYIRITVTKTNSTVGGLVHSIGVYNGTTNSCVYSVDYDNGNGSAAPKSGNSSTQIAYVEQTQAGATGTQVAVATFDATNITLTWTLTGTVNASDMNILWEAQI